MSEYAETVKTADSMDSGVKLTSQHPDGGGGGGRRGIQTIYTSQPTIHTNGHHAPGPGSLRGDRFPTPMKRAVREGRDTPQTQV